MDALPPLKVTDPPAHTALVLLDAVTTGIGFTVIVTAATFVLVQPAVLVPVTEYDPVAVGVYETLLSGPPVHV